MTIVTEPKANGPSMRSRPSMASTRAFASWLHRGCVTALMLLSMLQRPGETTFDTKFDLTADPGRFLARALHLWNPYQNFGELQNQAYGYLFPQGLFAYLADLLGFPDWLAQRLWSGLLLVAAYEGCRRLHRALVRGRPVLSVLAGLAYATAPRLLGLSGVLSAEVLPTAVLPWAALPVVLGLKGRISPRAAGLWSGVAVLFMGGVNAVENLAALPLVALLVAAGLRTVPGRRLAGWWLVGTTAASLWWFLPLLILGRYSPAFLDYIETAAATTRPLGWFNIVRGADHWVAFIDVAGRPWWSGAWTLSTEPLLMLLTALVSAVSLAGLFARDMPMRTVFASSALLGMGLLAIGHAGVASSPLDDQVRDLLDGALAALRNVHKVDPLVRLPMALGFAHAVGALADRLRSAAPRRVIRLSSHPLAAPLTVCLVVGLLALSSGPLVTGRLRNPGWTAVPAAWKQASRFLADQGEGTVLVVPASGFGQQRWGWTIDEPVQGVASTRWVTRSQVPLVPGPTIRFLDAIEERLADGVGSLALADTLAGAGIGWVLVRRDLDTSVADTPAPAAVDAAIAASPGLELAASFGTSGLGRQPLIDVYRVGVAISSADAASRASLPSMAGGPEDLITMREVGLLRPGRHALFGAGVPQLVGDSYRRQERQFGRVHDALSQVMTATERYRTSRDVHDYPGVPGQHRVVARYDQAELVTASSSAGYADAFGPIRPEVGPASVVDRDRTTYWQSAPFEDPVGQWVQIDFGHVITPRGATIVAGVDTVSGSPVRRVRVEAGRQRAVVGVNPFTGEARVPLDGSPVRSVRVVVEKVAPGGAFGVVALREISVAGQRITRSLVLPDIGAARATSMVMRAQPARRACFPSAVGPTCSPGQARARLEQLQLRRTFVTHQPSGVAVRGSVTARSTTQAAALLDPVGDGVTATATSTLSGDLLVSPRFAVDGNPATPWVADPADRRPTLRLAWNQLRTLRRLQVATAAGDYTRPLTAVLTAGGERRTVSLDAGGFGFFEPFRARSVTVEFPRLATGQRPVAIGELELSGIEDLVRPVRWGSLTGAPCGLGPEVRVDGDMHSTEVRGTVGDLLRGTPLSWRVCDGPVHLAAGRHDVRVDATVQYAADRLVMASLDPSAQEHTTRSVSQRSWSATRQTYEVGPGEEAVLRVAQNVNRGWVATARGSPLDPITVDGWQQGFVVPSGPAVSVELVFAPDLWYRLALLVGLLSAVLLVLGALFVTWRRPPRGAACRSSAVARPIVSGGRRADSLAGPVLTVGGASLVTWLVGGPLVALALLATSVTATYRPRILRWAPVAGALLIAVSGVLAVGFPSGRPGVSPLAADLLVAVGVGILATTVIPRRCLRPGQRQEAPAGHG